jgi:GntR family transcriptional regulator/MocR family aminotransferase
MNRNEEPHTAAIVTSSAASVLVNPASSCMPRRVRFSGVDKGSSVGNVEGTSEPPLVELLASVTKGAGRRLRTQIEDQLRDAIRSGALRPATRVPSTRDLARQLGVSRRVVVNAYAQLDAEGYLVVRQGAQPRVSSNATGSSSATPMPPRPVPAPRFDLRASVPDLSGFPRAAWLRSLREALSSMPDAEFDYGDLRGVEPLRVALAGYLGRVRGVVADPDRVVVTTGFAQARGLVCQALVAAGARRVAIEDPSHPEQRATMIRAGLTLVPVAVDDAGLRVDLLDAARADAVIFTPAHQFPSGAVLSSERRTALLEWLRRRDAIAVEDDYDAEFRYDRAPVGALQGLEPDRIVYAGSASKTLAPALRLGWLVVPDRLLQAVVAEKRLADLGTPRIDQHAFADFLSRGELDRHLRRMRARYRKRRAALLDALAERIPEAEVQGIAAGLHAAVKLPAHYDEDAVVAMAGRRRIHLTAMGDYRIQTTGPPTILVGYAQHPEPTIRAAVAELIDAMTSIAAMGAVSR